MFSKNSIKIVLFGPSGVGKTTLKKIFFEYEDPEKLLKEPLEPTYGIEINDYEMKQSIGIHDCAGQQIQEWFENANSIFFQTDLLILILDSNENWNENEQLWLKLYSIRKKMDKTFIFSIFFHKWDLISVEKQKAIKKQIEEYNFPQYQMVPFITSIHRDYFQQTFQAILNALKLALIPQKKFFSYEIIKLNLIGLTLKKPIMTIDELSSNLISSDITIQEFLDEYSKKGLLILDIDRKTIRISIKGREMIDQFKKKRYFRLIEHETNVFEPIMGIIISDRFGRPLFSYENRSDFFKTTFSLLGTDVDPAMVTGFFYATKSFGDTLNVKGLDSIEMKGSLSNILIASEDPIFGIFFLDPQITTGKDIKAILDNYIHRFKTSFISLIEKELKDSMSIDFSDHQTEIDQLIRICKNQLIDNKQSKEKIQLLYAELNTRSNLNSTDVTIAKKGIFQGLLDDNINELQKYLLKYKKF